jgi:hypothetical protein
MPSLTGRRHKKNLILYARAIEEECNSLSINKRESLENLEKLIQEIKKSLFAGKINDAHYGILKDMILDCEKKPKQGKTITEINRSSGKMKGNIRSETV